MVWEYIRTDTAPTSCSMLTIQLHNEFSAPQHHPPMPPTKAMSAITQNRRGHPTKTPSSMSWYSGVVGFGRARERQNRLLGCIFWAIFDRRGGVVTLAELQWEDQIGPSIPVQKINHTTINHRGPLNVWRIGWGMERRPYLWRQKLGGIFSA